MEAWKVLDGDSANNFRLTCVSAKQLSEVLIKSANFLFEASPADAEGGGQVDEGAADQSSALASCRAALLGRLPRLRALEITGFPYKMNSTSLPISVVRYPLIGAAAFPEACPRLPRLHSVSGSVHGL